MDQTLFWKIVLVAFLAVLALSPLLLPQVRDDMREARLVNAARRLVTGVEPRQRLGSTHLPDPGVPKLRILARLGADLPETKVASVTSYSSDGANTPSGWPSDE